MKPLQAQPKNTDGFDSINTDGLTVTNTRVDVGDDCFSPKPNTANVFVQNLWCNNTHGVSMGSIGQYPGVEDIIENVYIENVTLLNGQVCFLLNISLVLTGEKSNPTNYILEWSPPQSLGRTKRRLWPHQQRHIQRHPHRKH